MRFLYSKYLMAQHNNPTPRCVSINILHHKIYVMPLFVAHVGLTKRINDFAISKDIEPGMELFPHRRDKSALAKCSFYGQWHHLITDYIF